MAHLYMFHLESRSGELFLTCATGFDRDLSIAGRAFVKAGDGSYTQKLIKIDRPSTDPREVVPTEHC